MNNARMVEEDLRYIFHPCSQMKDYEANLPLIPIQRGEGVYLYDFDGNRYLDAISSWWVNLFGHANPTLNARLKTQLDTLEHVIFAGFTHEPAITLARRLVALAPEGLERVFFSDNGSSAIEIALKMSFQSYKNRGELRPYFISLQNSYHGETMGALAVGDVAIYKEVYNEILIRTLQAKSPALCSEEEALEDMERLLKEYEGEVASVVIEPLVQCAGGMAMYDPSYITKLRTLCDRYGVHLVGDEMDALRLRAGGNHPRSHVPLQGDHRRLPAPLGHPDDGGYLPRLLLRLRRGKILPRLPQLHRQHPRLLRRQRGA